MAPSSAAAHWSQLTDPERAVALEVLLHGPIARSDLARRLRLSPGSLTRLAGPLVEGGILRESAELHHTSTGRQGRGLQVVTEGLSFVGVRLTGDTVTAVLTDLQAGVITSNTLPLAGTEPDSVAGAIASCIADLTSGGPHPSALGIGLGGSVAADGTVLSAVYLGWQQVEFASRMRALTGITTYLENDVVSLTTAEHWFGAGRGRRDLAVLTLGTGIGSGLVVHDQVLSSVDSGVGLLGHLPLGMPGPVCPDGHVGCATAVLTDDSLTAQAAVALRRPVTREELRDLARAGDNPAVARICADLATGLGRLIGIVANVTQLPYVIVAGEGVPLAGLVLDQVRAEVAAVRHPAARPVEIALHEVGSEQWARGAAAVAVQRFVSGDPAPAQDRSARR